MELSVESFGLEPVEYHIDAMRDDQGRTLLPLGEEVTHGAVEGSGVKVYSLARARQEREGTLNAANRFGGFFEQNFAGFFDGEIVDLIGFEIGQIDDPFYIGVVHSNLRGARLSASSVY